MNATVTNLENDLRDRWVPSTDQIVKANEMLAAHPEVTEVYSLHLLVFKHRHFWTTDVVVEHLDETRLNDRVYLSRSDALEALKHLARAYHDVTEFPVVGGYTVHFANTFSDWAVFEDGVSAQPKR